MFERTISEIEQWVPRGRLLDVGTGFGELMEAARRRGWEVAGVDPSPLAEERARELFGFELITSDLEPGVVPDESFDAVVLHYSIEHVANPREVLQTSRAALRTGGILHVATTNLRTVDTLFNRDYRVTIFDPPRHTFVFTDHTLRRLVARCGFDVVLCRPQVASILNPVATRAVMHELDAEDAGQARPQASAPAAVAVPAGPSSRRQPSIRWRIMSAAAGAARIVLPGSTVRLYAVKR
jgi:SAM-dependent methyltransferase